MIIAAIVAGVKDNVVIAVALLIVALILLALPARGGLGGILKILISLALGFVAAYNVYATFTSHVQPLLPRGDITALHMHTTNMLLLSLAPLLAKIPLLPTIAFAPPQDIYDWIAVAANVASVLGFLLTIFKELGAMINPPSARRERRDERRA